MDKVNPVRNSCRCDSKPSGALNTVRDLSLNGINPALRGGTPYGAEPGIILKKPRCSRRPSLRLRRASGSERGPPSGACALPGRSLARRDHQDIISNGANDFSIPEGNSPFTSSLF